MKESKRVFKVTVTKGSSYQHFMVFDTLEKAVEHVENLAKKDEKNDLVVIIEAIKRKE